MRPFPESSAEFWRTIPPLETIGYPTLSAGYINDLMELAGPVPAGARVEATFTQVDGLWYPIAESLSITL